MLMCWAQQEPKALRQTAMAELVSDMQAVLQCMLFQ